MTLEDFIPLLMEFDPDEVNIYNFANDNGFSLEDGASKFAFVPKGKESYVIKFCRDFYCDLEENECEREANVYLSGCDYRIERVLLKTEYLLTGNTGIRFYIQEKYTCTNQEINHNSHSYRKRMNHAKRSASLAAEGMYYTPDYDWMATVISLYGKKFARSLEAWSYENKVNDLHNSNIGYLNNRPVIFDYCGFYG